MQQSGESYDRARETLKHVSVDASGKVELEDWVEVREAYNFSKIKLTIHLIAECQAQDSSTSFWSIYESWQGYG